MRGPSTYSYIGDVASEDLKSITTFRILLVVPSNRSESLITADADGVRDTYETRVKIGCVLFATAPRLLTRNLVD
jgi:hypothetical protein